MLSARAREARPSILAHPMHLRLSDKELATLIEMVSLAADVAAWKTH